MANVSDEDFACKTERGISEWRIELWGDQCRSVEMHVTLIAKSYWSLRHRARSPSSLHNGATN